MKELVQNNAAPRPVTGLHIPPRPSIIADLEEEARKPAPNLDKLAELISRDVSLAALTLRTVNSPAYGLPSKVTSIKQAIVILGISQITRLVTEAALRLSLGGGAHSMERFWDSAAEIANISRRLAKELGGTSPEEAYSVGLFLDCGIPLLMQKFQDYKDTLRLANQNATGLFVQPEEERYNTNHAVVGYFVCKSWHMPDTLCDVIRHHHDPALLVERSPLPESTTRLIAITKLAEHISHTYRSSKSQLNHQQRASQTAPEWTVYRHRVVNHFSLLESGFNELIDDTLDWLQEHE